jgi:hypothetical protein
MAPTAILGRGGEGRADGAVEGTRWRPTRRTRWKSGRQWVCGEEMTGLGFKGSDTLKNKNSSDGWD